MKAYIIPNLFLLLILIFMANTRTTKEPFVSSSHQDIMAKKLRQQGFLTIKQGVPADALRALKTLVMDTVEREELEFGEIDVKNEQRLDMNVPINSVARRTVHNLYGRLKGVFDRYDSDPLLIEHSCFLNFPGSHPQNWHRDVESQDIANNGKLFTVGVALDDISSDMGPLQLIPKSHRIDALIDAINQRDCHDSMANFCGYFHDQAQYRDWTCRRGDVLVWDATLLHRSGGNRSGRMRGIYYFSLLFKTAEVPSGSTHSLMRKYKKRPIRVNNFRSKSE